METNQPDKPVAKKIILDAESKRWLIHGPRHTRRNVFLGTALVTLFCILLFAKLSAAQAYAVSATFIGLAGYAIALGFRD